MTFSERLRQTMKDLNLTQAQIADITGVSRSAVSQYLSGANIPPETKQAQIAEALGLEEDYFQQEEITAIKRSNKIPRLTTDEAARLMGLSKETITAGLREGVFPWGYAIHGSGSKWIYFINAKRFAEIEQIII